MKFLILLRTCKKLLLLKKVVIAPGVIHSTVPRI